MGWFQIFMVVIVLVHGLSMARHAFVMHGFAARWEDIDRPDKAAECRAGARRAFISFAFFALVCGLAAALLREA